MQVFSAQGTVTSTVACDDVHVDVKSSKSGSEVQTKALSASDGVNGFLFFSLICLKLPVYEFVTLVAADDEVVLTPRGCDLLFTPASITVSAQSCLYVSRINQLKAQMDVSLMRFHSEPRRVSICLEQCLRPLLESSSQY